MWAIYIDECSLRGYGLAILDRESEFGHFGLKYRCCGLRTLVGHFLFKKKLLLHHNLLVRPSPKNLLYVIRLFTCHTAYAYLIKALSIDFHIGLNWENDYTCKAR